MLQEVTTVNDFAFKKLFEHTNTERRVMTNLTMGGIFFSYMRHSHTSLLLIMNENLKTISAGLGHSGIGIKGDIYAHIYPDAQREAANKK